MITRLLLTTIVLMPLSMATACPIPVPCEPAPTTPTDVVKSVPETIPVLLSSEAPAPLPRCGNPIPVPVPSAEEHALVAETLRRAITTAILRAEVGGEKSWGKKVISDELGEEIATITGFSLHQRSAQHGRAWIDARDAAAHPEILMYRIRWFNGRWSKWFIPGVNDRDWKDTTGRVWRYFTDHEHAYITIDGGGPMTTRQQFIGFNP